MQACVIWKNIKVRNQFFVSEIDPVLFPVPLVMNSQASEITLLPLKWVFQIDSSQNTSTFDTPFKHQA